MRQKRWIRIWHAVIVILGFSLLAAGCSRGLDESEVPYADSMLENILEGIAERDYSKFSMDFSENVKSAVKEEDFHSLIASLDEDCGEYEKRSFLSAVRAAGAGSEITIVKYQATYSRDSDVVITIYFSELQETMVIEGLLFDSPSLIE